MAQSNGTGPLTPTPLDIANTWEGVEMAARIAGAKYPELVAAQWALESGWGKYESGRNNLFGLKGEGTHAPTKEEVGGQMVPIVAGFRDFPTRRACVEFLVRLWYQDYKNWKGINRAKTVEDAARQLVAQGYATDTKYADKLIGILQGRQRAKGPQLPPVPTKPTSILLKVAPEFQNDNQSGTGYRECFSSSCAMLARFHGKIGSDDAYNKVRAKYGDTTSNVAQIKALESLGLRPSFTVNNGFPQLEAELLAGFPVAVLWLHKGVVTAPSGGGHCSVVIGFTAQGIIHNDPNGEADLILGGYVSRGKTGAGVAYSRKNWGRRWMADDRGAFTPGRNGWMLTCRP